MKHLSFYVLPTLYPGLSSPAPLPAVERCLDCREGIERISKVDSMAEICIACHGTDEATWEMARGRVFADSAPADEQRKKPAGKF